MKWAGALGSESALPDWSVKVKYQSPVAFTGGTAPETLAGLEGGRSQCALIAYREMDEPFCRMYSPSSKLQAAEVQCAKSIESYSSRRSATSLPRCTTDENSM